MYSVIYYENSYVPTCLFIGQLGACKEFLEQCDVAGAYICATSDMINSL